MNIDKELLEIKTTIGKIKIKKCVIKTLITTTFVLISGVSIYHASITGEIIPLSIVLTTSSLSANGLTGLSNYVLNKDLEELEYYKRKFELKKEITKTKK